MEKWCNSPQNELTSWILTLLSGQPNDDNHHCVGLCSDSTGEWCDNSCSYKLYPLCEGTENQIEKLKDFDRVIENRNENLKTKVNENFEIVTNQIQSNTRKIQSNTRKTQSNTRKIRAYGKEN